MKRSSFETFQCSLAQTLERVGDWWTPLILRDLYLGIRYFDEFVENLGLSRNLLAKRLKELEAHGIVSHEKPPVGRAFYALTPAGIDFIPILMALTTWGDKWATPDGGPPVTFRHKGCNKISQPQIVCSECNEVLTASNTEPVAGPGARTGQGTKLLGEKLRPGMVGAA